MEEQGDGSHVGPNDELPNVLEVDHGDMEHFILVIPVHPLMPLGFDVIVFFWRPIWVEDENPDDADDNDNDNEDIVILDLGNIVNNIDSVDNNDDDEDDDDNNNNHQVEDADAVAAVDMEVSQYAEVAEEDPLLEGSRRRHREDEDEDTRSSKRFRWWDEFAASDSEEESLPRSPSKRRSDDDDENERSEFKR